MGMQTHFQPEAITLPRGRKADVVVVGGGSAQVATETVLPRERGRGAVESPRLYLSSRTHREFLHSTFVTNFRKKRRNERIMSDTRWESQHSQGYGEVRREPERGLGAGPAWSPLAGWAAGGSRAVQDPERQGTPCPQGGRSRGIIGRRWKSLTSAVDGDRAWGDREEVDLLLLFVCIELDTLSGGCFLRCV